MNIQQRVEILFLSHDHDLLYKILKEAISPLQIGVFRLVNHDWNQCCHRISRKYKIKVYNIAILLERGNFKLASLKISHFKMNRTVLVERLKKNFLLQPCFNLFAGIFLLDAKASLFFKQHAHLVRCWEISFEFLSEFTSLDVLKHQEFLSNTAQMMSNFCKEDKDILLGIDLNSITVAMRFFQYMTEYLLPSHETKFSFIEFQLLKILTEFKNEFTDYQDEEICKVLVDGAYLARSLEFCKLKNIDIEQLRLFNAMFATIPSAFSEEGFLNTEYFDQLVDNRKIFNHFQSLLIEQNICQIKPLSKFLKVFDQGFTEYFFTLLNDCAHPSKSLKKELLNDNSLLCEFIKILFSQELDHLLKTFPNCSEAYAQIKNYLLIKIFTAVFNGTSESACLQKLLLKEDRSFETRGSLTYTFKHQELEAVLKKMCHLFNPYQIQDCFKQILDHCKLYESLGWKNSQNLPDEFPLISITELSGKKTYHFLDSKKSTRLALHCISENLANIANIAIENRFIQQTYLNLFFAQRMDFVCLKDKITLKRHPSLESILQKKLKLNLLNFLVAKNKEFYSYVRDKYDVYLLSTDFDNSLNTFLGSSRHRIFVLQGESCSGKTYHLKKMMEYSQGFYKDYLLFYFPLEIFQQPYNMIFKQIFQLLQINEQQKQLLKNSKILWMIDDSSCILDLNPNPSLELESYFLDFLENWPNAKLILSAKTFASKNEYLRCHLRYSCSYNLDIFINKFRQVFHPRIEQALVSMPKMFQLEFLKFAKTPFNLKFFAEISHQVYQKYLMVNQKDPQDLSCFLLKTTPHDWTREYIFLQALQALNSLPLDSRNLEIFSALTLAPLYIINFMKKMKISWIHKNQLLSMPNEEFLQFLDLIKKIEIHLKNTPYLEIFSAKAIELPGFSFTKPHEQMADIETFSRLLNNSSFAALVPADLLEPFKIMTYRFYLKGFFSPFGSASNALILTFFEEEGEYIRFKNSFLWNFFSCLNFSLFKDDYQDFMKKRYSETFFNKLS